MKHRNITQADYHQVVVAPALFQGVSDFAQGDSLVAPAGTEGFAVMTGIAMGPVELAVVPSVDAREWPEHTSIELELGDPLVVHEWGGGEDPDAHPDGFFTPDAPGRYRVDVYAQRREEDYDTVMGHKRRKGLERYAVVFTLLDAHPVEAVEPEPWAEPEVVLDAWCRPVEREPVVLAAGRKRNDNALGALAFFVASIDDPTDPGAGRFPDADGALEEMARRHPSVVASAEPGSPLIRQQPAVIRDDRPRRKCKRGGLGRNRPEFRP